MENKNVINSGEFSQQDVFYMSLAIEQAHLAMDHGDVPVGAVLVNHHTEKVIAMGHNTKEINQNATQHAEINVITEASEKLGSWRLSDCTLYVTLEPCPMCTGAIMAARIPRVVCGAKDAVAGAMGSVWAIHKHPVDTKHTQACFGCMEEEARNLLQQFFVQRRKS